MDGVEKSKEAEKVVERARKRLKKAEKELEREKVRLQRSLERLAKERAELAKLYAEILSLLGVKEGSAAMKLLAPEVPGGVSLKEPTSAVASAFLGSSLKAAAAGLSGYASALGLAFTFGTASTGTPVACLAGAAAEKAALAWLGGGALSAGGGGMALGSAVLGGAAAGPAILVFGISLAKEGERKLTQARRFEKRVLKEVAKLAEFGSRLKDEALSADALARTCRVVAEKLKDSKREVEELLAAGGFVSRVKLGLLKLKLLPELYASKRLLEGKLFKGG
jgi:predicted transcriptional regulator